MKVIDLKYPLQVQLVTKGPVVLAMGFFDGVHRGHRQVIRRAQQIAYQRHQPLAVLTYDKLPAMIFQQVSLPVQYLTPVATKCQLLEQLGVDITYVMDFTARFASLKPQQFVDDFLVKLQPSVVVAGYDHTYGPKDIANMDQLPTYAKGRFDVVKVAKLTVDHQSTKVSSTLIRQLIDQGKVQQANYLLGYHYLTSGIVVHGFARGRTIGFPTANVQWDVDERIPAVGAYAVQLFVQGHWYDGMASVGYNVTFGAHQHKTIEVNLFDFHQNIYGEHVKVRWVQRLRGETKFNHVKDLVQQLTDDRENSRQLLATIDK